ncbi:hypothetical protein WN51_00455 [Melipona quadrifasciata]|uniref:Uncharacterized protein n=1 Tax=Melipona quadrifasciata TaxID=166423 RepID=A0A0N0BGF5_9HYME|nr:hypothetical protein WN51_00455 [Melipona quadrifasciata]
MESSSSRLLRKTDVDFGTTRPFYTTVGNCENNAVITMVVSLFYAFIDRAGSIKFI